MSFPKSSGTQTASAVFFDQVARRILSAHSETLPDLRGITILLPNYHVAQPLAQALIQVSNVSVLLLPQMVTLNDWAKSIQLEPQITTASQRHTLLYQELRKQKWFEQADLWSMTQELLALFDELTCSLNELPADASTFAAAVQQAYQSRQNESLQLEARLVFELWHAMQSGADLDDARAYQQQLAKLAMQADKPLFVLRTSDWDVLEQRFLDEYARHAEVKVFDVHEMGTPSLQSPPPLSSLLKFVASDSQARRKAVKNRNVCGIHEDFELLSNAALPSAAEFRQTANRLPFCKGSYIAFTRQQQGERYMYNAF